MQIQHNSAIYIINKTSDESSRGDSTDDEDDSTFRAPPQSVINADLGELLTFELDRTTPEEAAKARRLVLNVIDCMQVYHMNRT